MLLKIIGMCSLFWTGQCSRYWISKASNFFWMPKRQHIMFVWLSQHKTRSRHTARISMSPSEGGTKKHYTTCSWMLSTGHAGLIFEKVANVTSIRTFPKKENINVHVEWYWELLRKKIHSIGAHLCPNLFKCEKKNRPRRAFAEHCQRYP